MLDGFDPSRAIELSYAEIGAGLSVRQLLQIATKLLQSLACRIPSGLGFEFEIGSGAGIRTLNLAVNSRLLYR